MADPAAKLGGMALGAIFTIVTGSRDGAALCSGLGEWVIQRLKGLPAAKTLTSLSKDISRELLAHLEKAQPTRASGAANDLDAILDNAFEAIGIGPTIDEIIKEHKQQPAAVTSVVLLLLAKRFTRTDDPVRNQAGVLVRIFYERLLNHQTFTELSESSFRQAMLSETDAARALLLRVFEGLQTVEQFLLGLPQETTKSLRQTASNYLLDPQRAIWAPISRRASAPDLGLLLAKYRVIELENREQELHELASWCSAETSINLRLYIGAGGAGKTRLMIEACERQWRLHGWRAGFIRRTRKVNREILYRALLDDGRPLLAVFDYAELQIDEIQSFISHAVDRVRGGTSNTPTVRIVLLSREAGDWWNKELPAGDGEVSAFFAAIQAKPGSIHRLTPVAASTEDRRGLFTRWRAAFCIHLGRAYNSEVSPAWRQLLAQDGMERSLFIAVAALAAASAIGDEVPASIEEMLRFSINRERRHWRELTTGHNYKLACDGLTCPDSSDRG